MKGTMIIRARKPALRSSILVTLQRIAIGVMHETHARKGKKKKIKMGVTLKTPTPKYPKYSTAAFGNSWVKGAT